MEHLRRIIPVLGIQDRKLVKTVKFKKPRYIGDPINAVKIFNEKEVDELVILDIRASLDNREPNYQHLYEIAGEAFMPLAYGGGVSTFQLAKKVFECGLEKVILNTGFFNSPELAQKISSSYGAQSVVLSLDFDKNIFGKYNLYCNSGRRKLKISLAEVVEILKQIEVGEVILQDISRDGTFQGYNLDLLEEFLRHGVNMPLIVGCGAGSNKDFIQAFNKGASACMASSVFVYKNKNPESILINYEK